MSYYVFTNPEKERLAREAVLKKGDTQNKGYRADPRDGSVNVAHCALYHRLREENPKLDGEELVIAIYRGLGGKLEEFPSENEAEVRAGKLRSIRVKQAKKDAAL